MGTTLAREGLEILMSRDCPFCGCTHTSPYVDELEMAVMACRANAAPEDRGSLEAWVDRDMWVEAFSGP